MAIAALSSTTLSAALDNKAIRFGLASTSGISGAGSSQSVLVIDQEAVLVNSVPLSGVVEVIRGAMGTKARPHASGATVYIATKAQIGFLEGPEGNVGLTGDAGSPAGSLPNYMLPLGSERTFAGKTFVLVDFQEQVHSGVVVGIDASYLASVLSSNHQGAVGVVAEGSTASDTWGWVQITGTCSAQEAGGTSAITSAYVPIVASSVSSPAAGMTAVINTTSTPQRTIYNMFITGAATTNVTSAASHTGVAVPVYLNRPYVFSAATDIGMS
jgi:hypothetical protein